MQSIHTNITVFECTEKAESHRLTDVAGCDPEHRVFLNCLNNAAAAYDITLKYKAHSIGYIRRSDMQNIARDPSFNADYALCMYPSLGHVGPELGYIIHRLEQAYRHIFIVTKRPVGDMEQEKKQGINAITRSAIQRSPFIMEPAIEALHEHQESFDAEKNKILSYWYLMSFRRPEEREKLLSILLAT